MDTSYLHCDGYIFATIVDLEREARERDLARRAALGPAPHQSRVRRARLAGLPSRVTLTLVRPLLALLR